VAAGVIDRAAFKSIGHGVVIHEPVVILQPEQIELRDEVRVDAFVDLRGGRGLVIGAWVHIANHASLNVGGGQVELGPESAVAAGARVLGGSADPAWPSMSAAARPTRQSAKKGLTVIGPRAVVGANAVVLPGCHLGEGAILAAGGVATRPIPAGEVWGGVPARKLRDRRPRAEVVADAPHAWPWCGWDCSCVRAVGVR
jgi:acetyltransferase-like isoleucine patch superfamily enzyme